MEDKKGGSGGIEDCEMIVYGLSRVSTKEREKREQRSRGGKAELSFLVVKESVF